MIVAQLPRVTQAIATRASVPVQVPLGPVYMLQLANSYMNLAVPTSFASIAVGVRFMQRQGVPLAAAVTSGTINTLANNIVQGVMLAPLLPFSGATRTWTSARRAPRAPRTSCCSCSGSLLAAWGADRAAGLRRAGA